MTWTILIIKKPHNGWFINYIENKLLNQIEKFKLQQFINVLIYEPNIKFYSDYVNVIDDELEISDDYINVIYDKIKNGSDCIGLKGMIYVNDNPVKFNNLNKTDSEICLPITKLNPIKTEIIFNKINNIAYYINSENLINITDNIENVDSKVLFLQKTVNLPISIIITAYQTQDYIEECLDSIEKQTYFINNDNFEVLVGVDACQDTFNKLQQIQYKYRNLSIYMMSENKGTYITTNTLIDLAKYENVIRFDSDDIMTPNLVKEVFNNKKDNDIIMLGYVDIKDGQLSSNLCVAGGIIYFKKSVMDNIAGGYQPWKCAADSELMFRLMNKVKIMQLKKILFYRRIHDNSLTNRTDTKHDSELRNKYTVQIKSKYKDNEIKIKRIINTYKLIKKIIPISIFITSYKTQNFIEECLDSIENQTYFINNDNFEVLVGVDACEDTLNKLQQIRHKYRNLRIFMMDSNMGTYVTSNTLLDLVKYDNIIRFDSDDIMKLDMIEKISDNINCHFNIYRFGYDNFYKSINDTDNQEKIHYPHGVVLYKKELFEIGGGYQTWKCAADTEFMVRLKNKIKIKNINEKLFYRRQHNNSLTKNKNTNHNSELRNYYKNLIGNHQSIFIDKKINSYKEY